jgi:hypothetical protein
MKIQGYPYKRKRKFGESRKKKEQIRVDSWDKQKPIIIFIKEDGWSLTKNKEYQVIETKLKSYDDKIVHEKRRKAEKNKMLIGAWGHEMDWYFRLINDKGNRRNYPQGLFKIKKQIGTPIMQGR